MMSRRTHALLRVGLRGLAFSVLFALPLVIFRLLNLQTAVGGAGVSGALDDRQARRLAGPALGSLTV